MLKKMTVFGMELGSFEVKHLAIPERSPCTLCVVVDHMTLYYNTVCILTSSFDFVRTQRKMLGRLREDFTKTGLCKCNCRTNSVSTRGGAEAVMLRTGAFVNARKSPRTEKDLRKSFPLYTKEISLGI